MWSLIIGDYNYNEIKIITEWGCFVHTDTTIYVHVYIHVLFLSVKDIGTDDDDDSWWYNVSNVSFPFEHMLLIAWYIYWSITVVIHLQLAVV